MSYDITYMRDPKKYDTNEFICKTGTDSQGLKTYGHERRKVGERGIH